MKWTFMVLLLIASASVAGQPRSNPFANPHIDTEDSAPGRSGGTGFVLKAVMPSDHLALANIDGEILAIGETYEGYKIVEVSEEGVRLERGTASVLLLLNRQGEDDAE